MNIKKIGSISAAVLSGVMLVGTIAFAQSSLPGKSLSINSAGAVHMTGTVSVVSGATLSVTSWGGTWQVNAGTLSLANIQVGDTVRVEGTVSSGVNITAKQIKEIPAQPAKPSKIKVDGTISNLNATAGTFTLSTSTMGNTNVTTNSSTKVFLNGDISALANLSNGLMVTVGGSFDATANTITAGTIVSPTVSIINKEGHERWGWLKSLMQLGIKFNNKNK